MSDDITDEQIVFLRAQLAGAQAALAVLVEQTQWWNSSVESVIGRQPNAGIDIDAAKAQAQPLLDRMAKMREVLQMALRCFDRMHPGDTAFDGMSIADLRNALRKALADQDSTSKESTDGQA